jgi:hypothetical protein
MGESTPSDQVAMMRPSADADFLYRWPVRVSQGASPQVQSMLIDPQDTHGARELSYGPIPFRIPRLASSDINAWGSSASQHHPYTQGGYRPGYDPGIGGIERRPRTTVASKSEFVFHSRIPSLSDDRRMRAFAMRGSGSPSAGRMNIPASFVPTAPLTR